MTTKWIVTTRVNPGAPMRLILIPDAGGTAATFTGWSERLRAAEVGIVQLPGRGGRYAQSVSEAALRVSEEIVAGSGRPAVLFGHGLGALIAFEAARRLTARDWPVLGLFVSGQGAPSLGLMAPRISDLPEDQLIAHLQHRRHVLPADALEDPDVLRLLLPMVRADIAMLERYHYDTGSPLCCPIFACDAVADPLAARCDVEGWKRETNGRFTVQRFGGDRSYIQREREALTALIGNHLSVMAGALARSVAVQG